MRGEGRLLRALGLVLLCFAASFQSGQCRGNDNGATDATAGVVAEATQAVGGGCVSTGSNLCRRMRIERTKSIYVPLQY